MVCRSVVPARFSSIGATMSSRISVTEAPLYPALTVIVGCETFGKSSLTIVTSERIPANIMTETRTKTNVGRLRKRRVRFTAA
jgi:hypothetical protein